MKKEPRVSCSGLLNEIRKAAESASQLTRQLLSFSRRQIIEPRIIDVNRHIMHMQKMLMRLIGEDVALDMVFSENPGTVKIDRGQFEQILMNLVVNARDALPYGGRISVVTERVAVDRKRIPQDSLALPGTYIVLRVADTGLGMSEEVRKHIFEPFFTTKLDGMGTGLGLATIYGAVHQAGGFIEVRSEPGRGSEFSIFLPEAHGEVESFCRSENNGELMTGNETILLVEDETMVRELAERLLTRWVIKCFRPPTAKRRLNCSETSRAESTCL
jgi:signal transduction histidine kinase